MWPDQAATLPLSGKVILACGEDWMPFKYVHAGWHILEKVDILPSSYNLDQSIALQYLSDAMALKAWEAGGVCHWAYILVI